MPNHTKQLNDPRYQEQMLNYLLGKKSIAQFASASIINGQRVHISIDIVGE